MAEVMSLMLRPYWAIISDISSTFTYWEEPPMLSTSATVLSFSSSGTIFWST